MSCADILVIRETMTSTVDQCETKPLSSTLTIFDTFKSQDDDKDSDEESFHLPLLDCDDDIENGKEDMLESITPNPETEDDILNKFETDAATTPEEKEESLKENDVVQITDDALSIAVVNSDTLNECETSVNEPCDQNKKCDSDVFNYLEIIDETDGSLEESNENINENQTNDTTEKRQQAEDESHLENEVDTTDIAMSSEDNPKSNSEESAEVSLGNNKNKDTLELKTDIKLDTEIVNGLPEEENMEIEDIIENNEENVNKNINNIEIIELIDDVIQETSEDDNENNDTTEEVNEKVSNEENVLDEDELSLTETEHKNDVNKGTEMLNDNKLSELKDNEEKIIVNDNEEKVTVNVNEEKVIVNNNEEKVTLNDNEEKIIIDDDQESTDVNDTNKESETDSKNQTKDDEIECMEIEDDDDEQDNTTNTILEPDNPPIENKDDVTTTKERESEEKIHELDEELLNEPEEETLIADNEVSNMDVDPLEDTDKLDEDIIELNEEDDIIESEKVTEEDTTTAPIEESLETKTIPEDNNDEKSEEVNDTNKASSESEPKDEPSKIDIHPLEDKPIETNKPSEDKPIETDKPSEDIIEVIEEDEITEVNEKDERTKVNENDEITEGDAPKSEKVIEKDPIEATKEDDKLETKTDNNSENIEENKASSESDSKETSEKQMECDDLLDISVIRDADEDNASAIEEIINTNSSEKSDNDDQEDKQDNEVDEGEADQEDNLLSSDKDEHMEFEEENINSSDHETSTSDNIISEPTSDGENKDNEVTNSESESQHPIDIDVSEVNSNQSSVDLENKSEEQSAKKVLDDKDEPVKGEEESKSTENTVEHLTGKRPLSHDTSSDASPVANKKMRMSDDFKSENKKPSEPKKKTLEEKKKLIEEKKKAIEEKKKATEKKTSSGKADKMKTLVTFEKFMKNRNLGDSKLTRSDLEQFCLQKICEALVHKTETGELHQTIKKQEQIIENLRKDLQQLSKQTRDLDIVNKKLMNELRNQSGNQKPLVPLKITRSVGLQVKLNVGSETVSRRKPYNVATSGSSVSTNSPRTPNSAVTTNNTATPVNRQRVSQGNNNVRQVAQTATNTPSPRKTPTAAPILTQALQTRPTPPLAAAPTPPKRPSIIRPKSTEQPKPSAPGVIDLTDEDDKNAQTAAKAVVNNVQQKTLPNKTVGTPMKIIGKNVNLVQTKNLTAKGNQKGNHTPQKTVAVGQVKSPQVGMQARTVTVPQGVRLTPAQVKNGIAIPTSVVTSSAGGTAQLMYVVQQTNASGNSGAGVQKAVLLNFQPTNGVLASTINGSAVSVIPSKATNTMQLKAMSSIRKHPAPLPLPPPAILSASLKPLLPKPHLSIRKTDTGIILQWRMPYNLDIYEGIASYQLFAYQETNAPPSTDMWRKVGDVKALALPMACTLTQFADKNKYYFAVRSVDVHKRIGAFSDPEEISL